MTWRTLASLAITGLLGCTASDRVLEVRTLAVDAAVDQPGAPVDQAEAPVDLPDAPVDRPEAPDATELPSSTGCGPAGDRCSGAASCTYCSASGSRLACTCAASGLWECTPTDGSCGVACGPRNCLPDEVCRGLELACSPTIPVSLPLVYDCVRRPADCPAPAGCSCLQLRTCPTTSFFCSDQDAGTIECRCRP